MPRSPEQQRKFKRDRYHAYKQLCKDMGERPDWPRWWAHYSELVAGTQHRRLTADELACWWTERFSMEEIREMGRHLDYVTSEGVAA